MVLDRAQPVLGIELWYHNLPHEPKCKSTLRNQVSSRRSSRGKGRNEGETDIANILGIALKGDELLRGYRRHGEVHEDNENALAIKSVKQVMDESSHGQGE